jgi:hypothetical protein
MLRRIAVLAATAALLTVGAKEQPDLQQAVGALRESLARNKEQLRQYAWTETTEISLKGEVKKREQNECRYGADGHVVKIPLGGPPEPKKTPRGVKGKVVANKIDDLKQYMDRVGSLVRRYAPPDPEALKVALQAGKASIDKTPGGSAASLTFRDYAKPGDQMILSVDLATAKIQSFRVGTYLHDSNDRVSLDVTFSSLDDGVTYMAESVLNATAKQIQIKTTNFGFRRK